LSGRATRRPEREFSAGGVVVREHDGDWQCVVIVPSRRSATGKTLLTLPKGHPDGDETAEAAALREVREETGVEARVDRELGEVRYWYQRDGRRIAKRVTFFLLRWESGDPEVHEDFEVDAARWMPAAEAQGELSHRGERDMVARALSVLEAAR
jgi:8-oxo-dGTP pyrophosphatase MutT (NUDIX family)